MLSLESYVEVVRDLAQPLPAQMRYERLLRALQNSIPCDAVVLLQLMRGKYLEPRASLGLRKEALGRRFETEKHPRFHAILNGEGMVQFDHHSPLPDPYDGLIASPEWIAEVHDCMGIKLIVNGQVWGALTFDSIEPERFCHIDLRQRELAIAMTQAVLTTAEHIERLEDDRNHRKQVVAELSRETEKTNYIGEHPSILHMMEEIHSVAPSALSVLILGETGVGKELVARLIHQHSDRSSEPFVYLNCAALPEQLAEAELFGHGPGAYTDAKQARAGRILAAHQGTLFLDEIGELSLGLQAKLLRTLQEGEIQPIGVDTSAHVDVRIVAATNRDLAQEVEAGRFRADFYHRLHVFPLKIPPLRARGDDVLLIAEYMLEKDHSRIGAERIILSSEAQGSLLDYAWPGNVRELEHALSRAALRAKRDVPGARIVTIEPQHLDLDISKPNTPLPAESSQTKVSLESHLSLRDAVDNFKRSYIKKLFDEYGSLSSAARVLQVDRSNLLRTMKRLGISSKQN